MKNSIEFTRVNNDTNGNPRYVCHYLNLINENDEKKAKEMAKIGNKFFIEYEYIIALKKAKKIGGRKFHNKQYGGGIVFQCVEPKHLEKKILALLENN